MQRTKPSLSTIRNCAIEMAETYALMQMKSAQLCEASSVLADQLKLTEPMSDIEGALVQVIRRRPLPTHFETLAASARDLARIADALLADQVAIGEAMEADLPCCLPVEEVPA